MHKLPGIQFKFVAAFSLVALFTSHVTLAGGGKWTPAAAKNWQFQQPSAEKVALGSALFFDKELSGNRDISCATCHSPLIASVDGLSNNIGTGGRGHSVLRNAGNFPPTEYDPQGRGFRNMTPLFNLGHRDFEKLFWDGRVEVDSNIPQGFASPAGADLPFGFDSPLAALSIFAQTDSQEMLGEPGTNELADAALVHPQFGVWDGIVARLGAIPEYVDLFSAAFDEVGGDPNNMSIVHIGNALGAFQAVGFRSDNSPFDRYLRGDRSAMSNNAIKGAELFYSNRANCSSCHSGVFQTDHGFHAIGMPQVGRGFGDGDSGYEDFGREDFTGDPNDRYRFRTPSLRNVALTGPWGHDGAYNSLQAVIEHHLNANDALMNYDPSQIVMPPRPDLDAQDLIAHSDPTITAAIAEAIEIPERRLSKRNIGYLMDFMDALTDPSAGDLRKLVPVSVPSGLPLDD